jgi:hypothetical protein
MAKQACMLSLLRMFVEPIPNLGVASHEQWTWEPQVPVNLETLQVCSPKTEYTED